LPRWEVDSRAVEGAAWWDHPAAVEAAGWREVHPAGVEAAGWREVHPAAVEAAAWREVHPAAVEAVAEAVRR
jgi:hypothetical protein